MQPSALLAACLVVSLAGCTTTEVHRPFAQPHQAAVVRTARPTEGWDILADAQLAGTAVRFEDEKEAGEATYVVRNRWGQDLGMVDGLGRAWRFVPHEVEASWVGTGRVVDGIAQILDQEIDAVSLAPWPQTGVAASLPSHDPRIPSSQEGLPLERASTQEPVTPSSSVTKATSP